MRSLCLVSLEGHQSLPWWRLKQTFQWLFYSHWPKDACSCQAKNKLPESQWEDSKQRSPLWNFCNVNQKRLFGEQRFQKMFWMFYLRFFFCYYFESLFDFVFQVSRWFCFWNVFPACSEELSVFALKLCRLSKYFQIQNGSDT